MLGVRVCASVACVWCVYIVRSCLIAWLRVCDRFSVSVHVSCRFICVCELCVCMCLVVSTCMVMCVCVRLLEMVGMVCVTVVCVGLCWACIVSC